MKSIASLKLRFEKPALPRLVPSAMRQLVRLRGYLHSWIEQLFSHPASSDLYRPTRRRLLSSIYDTLQPLEIRCLPAALPIITVGNVSVDESDLGRVDAIIPVYLDRVSTSPIKFNFTTKGQTAIAGVDYVSKSGTITIPAGQASATISILVNGDTIFESNETFAILLSRPVNATLARTSSVVHLSNDDPAPVITIDDLSITEGSSKSLVLSLSNVSAFPMTITLQSGAITAAAGVDFRPMNKTVTIPAGAKSYSVSISTIGDSLDEPTEELSISLSTTLSNVIANDTALISILDNDPPALSILDGVVLESLPSMSAIQQHVVVVMSSPSTVPVSVRVYSQDLSAIAGRDYSRVSTTMVIPAGATSVRVPLTTVDDNAYDPGQSFRLVLSSPVKATIARATATVSISDNEHPPVLSVTPLTVTEGDSGALTATVQVTQDRVSRVPTTFQYQTNDGTAAAGRDYFTAVGTSVIPAGATSSSITIHIRGDRTDEEIENFGFRIFNPLNAELAEESAVIHITDNDAPPHVSFSNTRIAEGDVGHTTTDFTVELTEPSEKVIRLDYRSASHTAIEGRDFVSTSGTVVVPPGQTSARIQLTSLADTVDEPSRAFRLEFSNPVNVSVRATTAVVTITDDDGVQAPLFQSSDLVYQGSFGVPTGIQGSTSFEYGGNGLAYNASNNSLFIGSHVNAGLHIAEIQVPGNLSANGNLSTLTNATVLQPFSNVGGLLSTNAGGSSGVPILNYENVNLGSLLVTNGGLTGSAFAGYTGAEPQSSTHSHFRTRTVNLASLNASNFDGLIDIRRNSTGVSGRVRGGYMAEVPDQWKEHIGADFVTGAAGQNRIEYSSAGPALFGFDANSPAGSSGDPLVYYPIENPLQFSTQFTAQPLFNGTTQVQGVAFVPGTRSVIFIGSNGLSRIGYGIGSRFNDRVRTDSGFHSENGIYKYQIWAYDIEDFVAVRNGSKAAHEIRPTSVINFDLPTPEGSKFIGGTAFDPVTGRLFISQKLAGADRTPVIHVYKLGRSS